LTQPHYFQGEIESPFFDIQRSFLPVQNFTFYLLPFYFCLVF